MQYCLKHFSIFHLVPKLRLGTYYHEAKLLTLLSQSEIGNEKNQITGKTKNPGTKSGFFVGIPLCQLFAIV